MRWLVLVLGFLGTVVGLWFAMLPFVIVVGSAYANHPTPNNSPSQLVLVEAFKDYYYPLGRPLNLLGLSACAVALVGTVLSALTRKVGALLLLISSLALALWGVQLLYHWTNFGVFLGVFLLLLATGLAFRRLVKSGGT